MDDERIEGEEEFLRQNPHVVSITLPVNEEQVLNNLRSKTTLLDEFTNPSLGEPHTTVGPPSDIVPDLFAHQYGMLRQAERRISRMIGNGVVIQNISWFEDESSVFQLRTINTNLRHRDFTVGRHLRLHERYCELENHWFGACQIAKYLIRGTFSDQYWDAGYISKRQLNRMTRTGFQHERRESHFRMLIAALYYNQHPETLINAVGHLHDSRRIILADEQRLLEPITLQQRKDRIEVRMQDVRNMVYSCLWYENFVFHKRWRTGTVVTIAEGIFREQAFDRMPILADAIEDTGCDYFPMLQYLRGYNVTVPGKSSGKGYNRVVRPASVFQPLWTRGSYILKKILGDRFSSRRLP